MRAFLLTHMTIVVPLGLEMGRCHGRSPIRALGIRIGPEEIHANLHLLEWHIFEEVEPEVVGVARKLHPLFSQEGALFQPFQRNLSLPGCCLALLLDNRACGRFVEAARAESDADVSWAVRWHGVRWAPRAGG
jgi:hypothetical protein